MTPDTCRKTSSGFFGFALFCFLLPFVTLSCPGMEATLTGAQLATGTTLEGQPDRHPQHPLPGARDAGDARLGPQPRQEGEALMDLV